MKRIAGLCLAIAAALSLVTVSPAQKTKKATHPTKMGTPMKHKKMPGRMKSGNMMVKSKKGKVSSNKMGKMGKMSSNKMGKMGKMTKNKKTG